MDGRFKRAKAMEKHLKTNSMPNINHQKYEQGRRKEYARIGFISILRFLLTKTPVLPISCFFRPYLGKNFIFRVLLAKSLSATCQKAKVI
jgi:hypothetical protein